MYIGQVRLSVCLSVPRRISTLLHADPDVTWGNATGRLIVVHCWADLQSVLGFRCSNNTASNAKFQRVLYSLYAWL